MAMEDSMDSEETVDRMRAIIDAQTYGPPDDDGEIVGPFSKAWVLALLDAVDHLRGRAETLKMQRDESDRYRTGRLARERDEWEANAQEEAAEVDRLRAAIEQHREDSLSGNFALTTASERLWAALEDNDG